MNPLVNNWTYGETSPKLAGRFDLSIYQQGCETLQNFMPMKQGGITRRPPLKHVATTVPSRILSFTLSSGESFIIQLIAGKLHVWFDIDGEFYKMEFLVQSVLQDFLEIPYNGSEIWEVQYAQYYDRMYFVHRNHKQRVLYYTGGAFSFDVFDLTVNSDELLGRQSQHYPGVVAICQNRLYYASTHANPFTIWASRPYEDSQSHSDFTVRDTVTAETEALKDPSQWPTKLDANGNTIYDLSDASKLIEVIETTEEVITARCAMELELASGRNDKIMWIGGLNNILIGTEASEWMLPYDIEPTRQAASMQSSYGSMEVQPVILNNGLFYLQGGHRLREYTATAQGAGSYDHSFTADHILQCGVRQIVGMRSPEPMLVFLLKDGTLATFTYDQMYSIQAWSHIQTEGKFLSIAVKETLGTQMLVAVVERGGNCYMERFDFDEKQVFADRAGEAVDGDLEYKSLMVSNRFDIQGNDGVTLGRPKRVNEVWLRCLDSGKVRTGTDEFYMQETMKEVGSSDHRVMISGGSRREMRVRVESVGADPLTLLAMTYDVEVN